MNLWRNNNTPRWMHSYQKTKVKKCGIVNISVHRGYSDTATERYDETRIHNNSCCNPMEEAIPVHSKIWWMASSWAESRDMLAYAGRFSIIANLQPSQRYLIHVPSWDDLPGVSGSMTRPLCRFTTRFFHLWVSQSLKPKPKPKPQGLRKNVEKKRGGGRMGGNEKILTGPDFTQPADPHPPGYYTPPKQTTTNL